MYLVGTIKYNKLFNLIRVEFENHTLLYNIVAIFKDLRVTITCSAPDFNSLIFSLIFNIFI
jgi:hypothetical protein